MLASYETATFTVLYRGYDIEVSRAPSGWRASVYPRSAMMSPLTNHQIKALRKLRLWVASSAIQAYTNRPGTNLSSLATWRNVAKVRVIPAASSDLRKRASRRLMKLHGKISC